MRIWGQYRQLDAPYVRAKIVCKQFGIEKTVNFLVDLGAAATIIGPRDAKRLRIPYDQLKLIEGGVSGVGRRAKTCLMPETQLIFRTETGKFEARSHHLFVLAPVAKTLSKDERFIPSLLGRDFLNQMALLTDQRQNLVLITDEMLTV